MGGFADPDTRPTLYILCGLPFSGKSTVACAIAARTGGVIVSFDELHAEHGDELSRTRDTPAVWQAIRELAGERAAVALRRGLSVICDNTNFRVAHRDALRAVATAANARALVVCVDTPLSVIAARRARNRLAGGRDDIADADLDYVRERWQPPGRDEAAISVGPDMAMGQWPPSEP